MDHYAARDLYTVRVYIKRVGMWSLMIKEGFATEIAAREAFERKVESITTRAGR